MFCAYMRTSKGWISSCGYVVNHVCKQWKYCPKCGKHLRKEYMREDKGK